MKKLLLLPLALLLIVLIGCAGNKVVKPSDKTSTVLQAEAKPPADNATQVLENSRSAKKPDNETAHTISAEQKNTPVEKNSREKSDFKSRLKVDDIQPAAADIETGEKISLNFDDADIYEVINALSDFLGINYIIDPAVKGKVNIHTSGEIDKSQLLPILETIFDMNNIALVKFGDLYKIIPVKRAKKEILDFNIGRDIQVSSYDRVVIQIVPLRYVESSEVVKLLKAFVSKGGDIIEFKKGNILIIVDTAASIKKLLNLIGVIDADAFEHTSIRFFKIKNAEVKEVAKELESIFSSFGISKSTGKGHGLNFIPIERVSGILAVSPIPGIFEKVKHWTSILDTVDMDAEEQVFIYFVENGRADEIAEVLGKIYAKGKTKTVRRRTSKKTKKAAKTGKTTGSSFVEGEIKIVTDETTNSIIVLATPHDYSIIKETMVKLDIIPKQVLIEVLIADVGLSGDTQFGIEWALKGRDASIGGYKGQGEMGVDYGLAGLGGPGFTYAFDSRRLMAFLRAQASKNKLNILSSPHVLAANNKEARIEVGQEVPIVTSEYVPQDVETNTSTSRSIEYRSTGVILSVTPRINDKGLVAMEVTQEVSEAQPVVEGGIQSPVISNRKAETSLVVQDGQTIVIGGLIKEQTSKSITGIPFLSSIPLLSYLFSNTTEKTEKRELVIMITPHVINNVEGAELTTMEFKNKLGQIKKLIKRNSDYWKDYK